MAQRDLRAIVYGVGAMGSIVTRLLLDKGVQITGAIARSPEKVGRDLGDAALPISPRQCPLLGMWRPLKAHSA